ncbi:GMC family oxidoreductase N-terminal domain-containing protein [Halomonas sp. McH1-25]|uniref:GMC family oxidoreductase n=1 Tax=unclassified Halomonas TaxID=2609666 RepID=UPI001EF576CB|nr:MULTISPECIES: GMC family oxidoreductase N-terminal domain-containing protein [unclassified Halomonas]MCG7601056.1 GMC family oxidoreductase N-terminal domain-containing protein [Halomonas sp. McH1-25]MCP1343845.1 GMC family oxidoreductase N-terminal domain-containing protein [Halomonas sp. FL8]MCP1361220.1 GMC family oxidoreductase N-terminal domain-containing protein [Halomonas sp. BBD45]
MTLTRSYAAADTLIVGAGPAGCLLAKRLSEDPHHRVMLVEAGGRDNYPWIHIPVGYLYCIGNPRTDWCFRTEAEDGLHGRSLGYPRGRVLGGCSSINGMIYMRGQARDYDHWASLGNPGWSWADVLPLFRKSEDHYAGENALHGSGGEWRVEAQRHKWDILETFREAAAEVGIPPIEDFNGGDNEGSSYFQVNQRSGVRWNAAKAFLKGLERRPNFTLITDAEVDRVLFATHEATPRACGVRVCLNGAWQELRASEVILSAGAIGSPTILQRSGIGPRQLLSQLGIPVVHESPGVGENLQDHLQLRMIYRVEGAKTLNEIAGTWFGKLGMAWQYLLSRSGPMTMAPSQLGVFARSAPDQPSANLQYHVQPLSLPAFGEPLHPYPAFTASVCNLRPASRGRVAIRSTSSSIPPLIQPNYLSEETDRRIAVDAIRLTRRIAAAPALARYRPEEIKPGTELQSDDDLMRAAGDIGTTIFHPVGTCQMGQNANAVVDPRLRVHGVAGLRVVDASIMPTITSGNTCSPTLMIAEKAAAMILEERQWRAVGDTTRCQAASEATSPMS